MKHLVIVAGLLVVAANAHAQQTFNNRLVASDTTRARAPTERSTTSAERVVLKEFVTLYGGTVRLRWLYRTSAITNNTDTGVMVGDQDRHACDGTTLSTRYVVGTCDVAVPMIGARLSLLPRACPYL
jgi:hypothetical protein